MMSMILRSKAVVRLLWAKAQSARFYSENKGLVLGVYSDKEGKNWQLTPSGEKFDSDVNGALMNKDGRSSSASSHSGSNVVPVNRSASIRTTPTKRQRSTPSTSFDDKRSELLCPVCIGLINEAHMTQCGHTFCHSCILTAIGTSQSCPTCYAVVNDKQLFPNHAVNALVKRYTIRQNYLHALESSQEDEPDGGPDGLRDFVMSESTNLKLNDVNVMLEVLQQRKQLLEAESCAAQNKLLLEFLKNLEERKLQEKNQVLREIAIIKRDVEEIEQKLVDAQVKCIIDENASTAGTADASKAENMEVENIGSTISDFAKSENNVSLGTMATRKRRMYAHFDDFVQCYFRSRCKDLYFGREERTKNAAADSTSGLDDFREDLVKFSKYSKLQVVATLQFSGDLFSNSTIVSSIEFDKDNELLAIAGVTKRIKIFDYQSVVRDSANIHYPCMEMISTSKISCVSWNCYSKSTLAASDYEGTVTIWDASTGQKTKTYHEHEKRCWSVDFSNMDTRLIASGSDDAKVKLYNSTIDHSIATLEARANICSVKFNPRSSFHLAFACADHCLYYYDLRNMKEALMMFEGHKKAVSYVKFLNGDEIVSASTDSHLKMWNVGSPHSLRSFVGHVNEKNFVGLATDGDYIACGSENNALYVYYKGLTKTLFKHHFEPPKGLLNSEEERDEDLNDFVSAVCWRQNSNIILAANSLGTVNVLELV